MRTENETRSITPPRGFGLFEQKVLEKWKSVQHVYAFLKREFMRINDLCFVGALILPSFQIKLMRMSKRPLEPYLSAATYQAPFGDRPAEISLFPNILLDRKETQMALAHEMVHHWEWTAVLPEDSVKDYPFETKKLIRSLFPNRHEEKSWRAHHSPRFVKKATEVAEALKFSVKSFLFKG